MVTQCKLMVILCKVKPDMVNIKIFTRAEFFNPKFYPKVCKFIPNTQSWQNCVNYAHNLGKLTLGKLTPNKPGLIYLGKFTIQ